MRIADGVAWVDASELPGTEGTDPVPEAYVALVPDGTPVVLAGSAWAVWCALADGNADEESIAAAAAAWMATPLTDQVRADVRAFLARLVRAGLVAK